jgi:hypothetical protein
LRLLLHLTKITPVGRRRRIKKAGPGRDFAIP